jgi:hypothetical protein
MGHKHQPSKEHDHILRNTEENKVEQQKPTRINADVADLRGFLNIFEDPRSSAQSA